LTKHFTFITAHEEEEEDEEEDDDDDEEEDDEVEEKNLKKLEEQRSKGKVRHLISFPFCLFLSATFTNLSSSLFFKICSLCPSK